MGVVSEKYEAHLSCIMQAVGYSYSQHKDKEAIVNFLISNK